MLKNPKWIVITLFGFIPICIIIFSLLELIPPTDIKPTMTTENILAEYKIQINDAAPQSMSRELIIHTMHEMANTLIVADQIWGLRTITKDGVIKLMAEININSSIHGDEKQKLLNILYAWEKGDYRQGVAQHNYLWRLLNGNIGKARSLRDEYKK